MVIGRKVIYALLALVLVLAYWLFVWPVLGPVISGYLPLPGKNEVSDVRVSRTPDGKWMATVTYFYNGRPELTYVTLSLVGDPNEANGRIENQSIRLRRAVRGSHTYTEEIERPNVLEPVLAKQVIVELGEGRGHAPLGSRRLTANLDWPDRTAWELDREIARAPRDSVLEKASALVSAGDTSSLVKARAIVRRLVANDPKFQPAIDLSLRIADKAIWEKENVVRLQTEDDMVKQVGMLGSAFEELDELAANLRDTKARTSDGLPALASFHRALKRGWNNLDINTGLLDAEERYARRWLKLRPGSPTAQIHLADSYYARAWQARGQGPASSVGDAQWKAFKAWSTKAREVLEQCYPACSQDPKWYSLMLSVMQVLSVDNDLYFRTFVEGFERFPQYDPIFGAVAVRLTPRWGGSVESFESFAREVASKFPPDTRDAIYARIYSEYADLKNSTTRPNVSEWKIDCSRLVRGYDQIVSKYPTDRNLNVAAFMATQCQDRTATRRYLAKIASKPELLLWGDSAESATNAYARAVALAR